VSTPTVFEKRSTIKTTVEKMVAFHNDPNALKMLTPPPMFMQVKRDTRTSLRDGEIHFTLWMAFIPIAWLARHEPGPIDTSFADRMIEGPLATWRHEHVFTPVDGGVELLDRVTLSHKAGAAGLFSRLLFDGLPLHILFFYRHLRTRMALEKTAS
jgi:ligand-binding SRPBCC domain-containing protein